MPKEEKKTGMQQGRQMIFTDHELSLIKNTFKGNEELLKLMRKVFLPEIDPDAPLGQTIDLWMTVALTDKTPQDAYVHLLARNSLISHLDQQLLHLKFLSEMDDETPEEALARLTKNSTK
jgi:hypothetical protein